MFSTIPFFITSSSSGGGPSITYLLDTYTGAKRAYSVRKLSSSYTGDAIRVRRSSDNAEQNIGFVGEDLDTSALTTFCSGTDGFITTLYDQSGNGENATQSTASKQAQIVSSGTIYTTGTKSSFYVSSGRSLMEFTSFTTNQVAQLLVGKKASSTSDYFTAFTGNNPGVATTLFSHWTDSNIYFQWEDYYSFPNSSISNADYEVIFATTTSASTSVIWRNGSSLALSNNSLPDINNNYTGIFTYGISTGTPGSYDANAYYQELIIWDSNESANAAGIQTNINTYYSIY
jgi:hypothetical protein